MWREFKNLAYLSCLLFPMYRFMKDQCFLTANNKEQDHSVGMVALLHNGDLSAFTLLLQGMFQYRYQSVLLKYKIQQP
jgi:hypothetical protein